MPPQAKKGGLTLEKLTAFDDVITDALVDKVYFWTTIRKNRGGRFVGSRGLHGEDVANLIREHVIYERDVTTAVEKLLQLKGLRNYSASLKDEKDKVQFKRHLQRYVNIYMSDCPFEVTTTNRYTITEHEASITARRDIGPREEIKYLTGVQVAMTEAQEKSLELGGRDFSLVVSSRKKTRSLFLGPARFANHDCGANAKLSTKGYDGMQIVAVKPIIQGEEITVSYGDDYFGENNNECLCKTCEDRLQNGWQPLRRVESSHDKREPEKAVESHALQGPIPQESMPQKSAVEDSASQSATLRNSAAMQPQKRERDDETKEDQSRADTPSKRVKIEEDLQSNQGGIREQIEEEVSASYDRKRALDEDTTENDSDAQWPFKRARIEQDAAIMTAHTHDTPTIPQGLPISSIENPSTNIEPPQTYHSHLPQISRETRTQQREGIFPIQLGDTSSRGTTPPSPHSAKSPESVQSTDATSIDDEHTINVRLPKVDMNTVTLHNDNPTLGVATVKEEVTTTTVNPPWPTPADASDDDSSGLSDLSPDMEFDSENEQIVKRKPRPVIRATRSKSRFEVFTHAGTPLGFDDDDDPDAEFIENTRKQGDYMTSPSLLSAQYSKWVECQTCEGNFVQADGYLTLRECPRCERHSKLYGYSWPKTERAGKHDKEQRVRDHLTVHRFVDPHQERELKKKRSGKGLNETIRERYSTPRSARESASLEVDSGRSRRRVRKMT